MAVKTVEAILNSQTYVLRWDADTQTYKAVITAPNKSSYSQDGHYYGVAIRAEDDAGNVAMVNDTDEALGEKCQLRVLEKTPPSISVQYPTGGSTITSNVIEIRWTITDNDSGVRADTISIAIDDGGDITDGIITNVDSSTYVCSYTATLTDGSHNVVLKAQDNDGNQQRLSVEFKMDTAPPELVIEQPGLDLVTNNPMLIIRGRATDITSSPVRVSINDVDIQLDPDGTFDYTYDLIEGKNTIRVVAVDAVGKTSSVERIVTLDTIPPVFSEVVLSPNPVDAGNTFVITVRVDDQ